MANFQTYESKEEIVSFDLPLNLDVKLRQQGGDGTGNRLEVALATAGTGEVALNVLNEKLDAASTAFTVRGTRKGGAAEIGAYVAASGRTQNYAGYNLKLGVFGTPKPHAGYSVDLLSTIPQSGRSDQILLYSKIIKGPRDKSSMLSQDPDAPVLDCGDVAASYGKKLFGKETNKEWIAFYKPPKNALRDDLRFDKQQVQHKISRIRALLDSGIAVRVWVIDKDGFSIPFIQSDANTTHFLTIIGYGQNKFMYIDPWPGGSRMEYDGGMYDKRVVNFIGELIYDPMDLEKGIKSPQTVGGIMHYTVVAGPQ